MNQQNKSYTVLGIMSGTSFDGIDLCLAEFKQLNNKWEFKITKAKTIPYDPLWKNKIVNIENASASELVKLHFEYGHFLAKISIDFLNKYNLNCDLISSHGHTIFHQIENGFTFQLGHGAVIASSSEIPVVSDFRSLDVALGGEGAPLVPFGDQMLFEDYNCCINVGGIANLSFQFNAHRIAFDIVPANMLLNYLCQNELNIEFDFNGETSKKGKLNQELFDELNSLEFYQKSAPKSLGKEWVFENVIPLIEKYSIPIEDKLNTITTHISFQINLILTKYDIKNKVLLTGGGARNKFLVELLNSNGISIENTTDDIVDFKEALIFGFLGLMRNLEHENTFMSATGASKNSCGGSIFLP